MNNTKLVFLLLCSLFVIAVVGDISLTSTALVKERQFYESTLDHATQAILKQLSKSNEITKTSKISKVDMEQTKVAESILYSLNLQLDIGKARLESTYGLQFVQPLTPWRSVREKSTLPTFNNQKPSSSLTLPGSEPFYLSPEISLNLTGPMELYLPLATTDLSIKTPRNVDAGFVERIILKEGVNITLTGSVELRLRDSLSVSPSISDDGEFLLIDTSDKPKLNVYGHNIGIKNRDGEEIKVQKKYSSVLEISPSSSEAVVMSGHLPFEFPLNDSRIQNIQKMLQKIGETNSHTPTVHTLASGTSLEAVLSFLIPIQIIDESIGRSSLFDVVAVLGSNHKEMQVISFEKQHISNQVTFSNDVLNNGSYPDALARLHKYLQTSNPLM